jgi:hypothetical protein
MESEEAELESLFVRGTDDVECYKWQRESLTACKPAETTF